MELESFELFEKRKAKKAKKIDNTVSGETSNYTPPEYVVQPAVGDKGFFMFKDAFDKMKKRFSVGFFSTTVNNMK